MVSYRTASRAAVALATVGLVAASACGHRRPPALHVISAGTVRSDRSNTEDHDRRDALKRADEAIGRALEALKHRKSSAPGDVRQAEPSPPAVPHESTLPSADDGPFASAVATSQPPSAD